MSDDSAVVALCRALVQCPSLTPDDAGCQMILAAQLEQLGFSVETLVFGEVTNLWARRGHAAPLVVFAGHTDVVPVGDTARWRHPPFDAVVEHGQIIGRGTADMKGSIAAWMIALERFIAQQPSPDGSLGVLITSDEEGPAVDGTARVVETLAARGITIDHCIVGEPSSAVQLGDTLRQGRRGSLSGRLSVHGTQGHVAYPQLADNAIHRALPLLAELTSHVWDQGTDVFPPTGLQVSNIHAGTGAGNVIPDRCVVEFNLRFSPAVTPASIEADVQRMIEAHGVDAMVEWRLSARPFVTAAGTLTDAASVAIDRHTGIKPRLDTAGGTSDGRFLIDIASQLVELGPLNASIHQVDECVACDDLDTLSLIYQSMLDQLIGNG